MLKITELQTEIVKAMKAKETDRLNTLKMFKATLDNERIKQGKSAITDFTETEVQTIARSFEKRLKEEKEFIVKAGKDTSLIDLQISTIGEFLPQAVSVEEIEKFVTNIVAEKAITDKKGMGIIMGAVKGKFGTAVDMAEVKAVVDKVLA